jgi:hypothetical protein
MSTQRYSVTPYGVDTLLSWVKSGTIAIPEIQRPFVWDRTKVRNLLDSLYQGFPIGYLITWQNPSIRLKDGSSSRGKRILIDGQQRVTALMAALLGIEVLTKDYDTVRIRIAFHPQEERFEVANPAIIADPAWIADVADVFSPDASLFEIVDQYCMKNPATDQRKVSMVIEKLKKIQNNSVGVIDLADDLDIETVTEIFIRVNSAGVDLSQADFAMSKIAVNEEHGGNLLRKAIEYFCHLSSDASFLAIIRKNDKAFVDSEFFAKMAWLKFVKDDLYEPTYTDMLRVAFTSEFGRGRLQDLVALLSGRNFETKQFEEAIVADSFARLKIGILNFMNQTNFEKFTMILRSAGFVSNNLIGSQNAVNFAFVLFLRCRAANLPAPKVESIVRRWYAMSVLRARYTNSPETAFDFDIRQIESQGILEYTSSVIQNELPESFWTGMLPQLMETSSAQSPFLSCFLAAQVKLNDKGFLSRDITVNDLLLNRGDLHHIYPKKYLQSLGLSWGRYNQIANYVYTQSEINIAIGGRSPKDYFTQLRNQISSKQPSLGGIIDEVTLRHNMDIHCVPQVLLDGEFLEYDEFLAQRRKLMALRMRDWYDTL